MKDHESIEQYLNSSGGFVAFHLDSTLLGCSQ